MKVVDGMMWVLRQLESTTSLHQKREILAKYEPQIPGFKDMLVWALDPYRRFYLQQLGTPVGMSAEAGWGTIVRFLERASKRQVTGDQLEVEFRLVAQNLSTDGFNLFRRVVLKDLRCGVGAKLVNDVFPGLIPQFGVMLATPLQEHHVPTLTRAGHYVYGQPKANGDRVVVICPRDEPAEAFSRNGHVLHNYSRIVQALKLVTVNSKFPALVFDGEVICGDFFGTRGVKKLKGNEAHNAVFHCFDTIHHEQWLSGYTDQFRLRNELTLKVSGLSSWRLSENLRVVPTYQFRPEQISWAFFNRVRDHFINHGHEGLIVRPNAPYNFDTRSSLFKHKQMDTMDCVIDEILPGEEGKKHAHHAGAMMVIMDDGETRCKAGLKLSDPERDEMWENRGLYVGRTCVVAYQELTRNADNVPKMQFPVYLQCRDDK